MRTSGAFARHPADPCPIPRARGALPPRHGCESGLRRALDETLATNQRITRSTRATDETAGPEVQSSRPPRPTHAAKRSAARYPRRRRTLRVQDARRDALRWLTAASPPRAPRGAASEQTPVLERCSCPVWVAAEARLTPRELTWRRARRRCHSREVPCLPPQFPFAALPGRA